MLRFLHPSCLLYITHTSQNSTEPARQRGKMAYVCNTGHGSNCLGLKEIPSNAREHTQGQGWILLFNNHATATQTLWPSLISRSFCTDFFWLSGLWLQRLSIIQRRWEKQMKIPFSEHSLRSFYKKTWYSNSYSMENSHILQAKRVSNLSEQKQSKSQNWYAQQLLAS